ncbi:4-fold beta flower protein [Mesorhizobium sp. AaZ16]|uniref:4-fold beta flower protein n=1 Tax=Mesorhizobium sp. AaZ16 TaxID=3402289 RepID=UPI00374E28E6
MEFFDSNGHAVCYVTQTGRIYSWDGRPLATRKGDKVHTCDGEFVGWIRHGYLINEKGECCLFTQGADTKCGPYPPDRRPRPSRGTQQPFPELKDRRPAPSFPGVSRDWGRNPFRKSLLQRLADRYFGSRRYSTSTVAQT